MKTLVIFCKLLLICNLFVCVLEFWSDTIPVKVFSLKNFSFWLHIEKVCSRLGQGFTNSFQSDFLSFPETSFDYCFVVGGVGCGVDDAGGVI